MITWTNSRGFRHNHVYLQVSDNVEDIVCLYVTLVTSITWSCLPPLWIVNPSKIMSTERTEAKFIFLGLTIQYVNLLTIWHLYNIPVHAVVIESSSHPSLLAPAEYRNANRLGLLVRFMDAAQLFTLPKHILYGRMWRAKLILPNHGYIISTYDQYASVLDPLLVP